MRCQCWQISLFAVALLSCCPDLAAQHVIATIPIPGIDMQIPLAVNPLTNRVYALSDETSVDVIDAVSNAVVDVIPVGGYPRGVAVNPKTNLIYVPINYTLNVIDGNTNSIVHKIAVPNGSSFPAVNPITNRIYLVQDSTVSVIDGGTNSVIATITGFAGFPIVAVVDSRANQVYVTYQNPAADAGYAVVDGLTNTITHQVSVAAFGTYLPLLNSAATDALGKRVYFGDQNNFEVFVHDVASNVLTKVDLSHTVQGVAAVAGTNTLMACRSGGNSVTVIDVTTGKVTSIVKVGALPHAIVYDSANKRAYVANLGDRTVSVLTR
jgi:YVTN family beta-propeller protein